MSKKSSKKRSALQRLSLSMDSILANEAKRRKPNQNIKQKACKKLKLKPLNPVSFFEQFKIDHDEPIESSDSEINFTSHTINQKHRANLKTWTPPLKTTSNAEKMFNKLHDSEKNIGLSNKNKVGLNKWKRLVPSTSTFTNDLSNEVVLESTPLSKSIEDVMEITSNVNNTICNDTNLESKFPSKLIVNEQNDGEKFIKEDCNINISSCIKYPTSKDWNNMNRELCSSDEILKFQCNKSFDANSSDKNGPEIIKNNTFLTDDGSDADNVSIVAKRSDKIGTNSDNIFTENSCEKINSLEKMDDFLNCSTYLLNKTNERMNEKQLKDAISKNIEENDKKLIEQVGKSIKKYEKYEKEIFQDTSDILPQKIELLSNKHPPSLINMINEKSIDILNIDLTGDEHNVNDDSNISQEIDFQENLGKDEAGNDEIFFTCVKNDYTAINTEQPKETNENEIPVTCVKHSELDINESIKDKNYSEKHDLKEINENNDNPKVDFNDGKDYDNFGSSTDYDTEINNYDDETDKDKSAQRNNSYETKDSTKPIDDYKLDTLNDFPDQITLKSNDEDKDILKEKEIVSLLKSQYADNLKETIDEVDLMESDSSNNGDSDKEQINDELFEGSQIISLDSNISLTGMNNSTDVTNNSTNVNKIEEFVIPVCENFIQKEKYDNLIECSDDFYDISMSEVIRIENEYTETEMKNASKKNLEDTNSNRASSCTIGTVDKNIQNDKHFQKNLPSSSADTSTVHGSMPVIQAPKLKWVQQMNEEKQKLRLVIQEIKELNNIILQARRELWPTQFQKK